MNKTKIILITGSSRGIGKAIAALAHQQGYKVIVHGRKESKELDKTYKSLSGSLKIVFDVANKQETNKAIGLLLDKLGTIDVLVNNAGIALNTPKDISEIDDEKALQEWKVNVLGPIHCIQAVLPSMLKKGKGNIINIASIKAYPNYATLSSFTYGHTKAAVLEITKALAKVYSPCGIRFNAVAPGYVLTDISRLWSKEAWERVNNGILLERVAKPEEIAPLVMFLASDESSYITGSDFLIDGGYSLKGK
jgi:3-oxoacyl-[acyl-carrier protein] reductase